MKLIRNIILVLALILLGVVVGFALGGQGDGGGDGQTPSRASTVATRTRAVADTATRVSGSGETSASAAVPTATEGSGAESGAEWGVVVRVADGDTLTVRFDSGEEETIRLLDVDTPETVHPNRPEDTNARRLRQGTPGDRLHPIGFCLLRWTQIERLQRRGHRRGAGAQVTHRQAGQPLAPGLCQAGPLGSRAV